MNINWDFEKLSAAPTKMNTCKLYVLVFCCCIKSYHKLKTIFSSQVCRSEIWQGVSESPARGVTRPRPKERAGLSPHLRSRGETHVIAHLGHWQNSSPWGSRTEGPVSLLTVSRGPPSGLWGHSPVLACGPPYRQASNNATRIPYSSDLISSSAPSFFLLLLKRLVLSDQAHLDISLSLGCAILGASFGILPTSPYD